MAVESPGSKKKGYVPKWQKKQTLAEQIGKPKDLAEIGLKGNINVIFKQGNETRTTIAMTGQPIRDVATQAGQFIKYGCGKGECGTCECLVNGKWIRPCSTVIPADLAAGDDFVIQVKEVKAKDTGSGKFYTFKSIVKGFYNNLLGMVGFVKYRRAAKKNWNERREYEDLVKQKTMERKMKRLQTQQEGGGSDSGLSP